MSSARVRPPILPGPSDTQFPRPAARGIASACSLALRYRSVRSSPPGGVRASVKTRNISAPASVSIGAPGGLAAYLFGEAQPATNSTGSSHSFLCMDFIRYALN
jgi:hypothetical protein